MSSRTISIGLCGLGTVGQGVWKHLSANRSALEARLGVKLELPYEPVQLFSETQARAIIAVDPRHVDAVMEAAEEAGFRQRDDEDREDRDDPEIEIGHGEGPKGGRE